MNFQSIDAGKLRPAETVGAIGMTILALAGEIKHGLPVLVLHPVVNLAYIPKATMQAAIGAVPLAAGIPAGEVILAVAVLSILLTAPLGAFGIMLVGEKVLDHSERSAYRFKELRGKMDLPRVGERVRSKQYGTVWKVIEEKEIWLP
jgi:hypothetical protein